MEDRAGRGCRCTGQADGRGPDIENRTYPYEEFPADTFKELSRPTWKGGYSILKAYVAMVS